MRRVRALWLGLILALPWLGPAAAGSATACAAEAGQAHAALVVDTGSRTTTYCVRLDAARVTGLHMIQLAGAQYGLAYRLGFGGQAVCELNGVGSSTGDCFSKYPDFWGYWHGDGGDGWDWAGTGASSASIGGGDVEGWSWGSGDSTTTHPPPPRQAFDDVCETTAAAPSPSPKPTHTQAPSHSPAPIVDGGGAAPSAAATASARTSPSPRVRTSSSEGPAPGNAVPSEDIVRAEPANGRVSADGPPGGALLALGVVALLGAGGWLAMRRRRDQGDA